MNKRIEVFKNAVNTSVICTRRASQDIWEPSQDVEHFVYDIDLPSARHILKRYAASRSFEQKALKALNQLSPSIIYTEGLDALMIAGKYKARHDVRIILEVADLRENYIVKPKRPVDRLITEGLLFKERTEFKHVDYLVLTSPKFYDVHYRDLMSKEKTVFIPNTPNPEIFRDYRKKQGGEFTVGFIGGIRYLDQMKMLVDASQDAKCRVLFAGAGGTSSDYKEIRDYCENKKHVRFTGKYDYTSQITSLYGMVDCVYAVYDADNPNVRIALPNKLYESVICELPIIVAKGTYLEELVRQWGVGISVDHHDKRELAAALSLLKSDSALYNGLVDACQAQKTRITEDRSLDQLKNILDEMGRRGAYETKSYRYY